MLVIVNVIVVLSPCENMPMPFVFCDWPPLSVADIVEPVSGPMSVASPAMLFSVPLFHATFSVVALPYEWAMMPDVLPLLIEALLMLGDVNVMLAVLVVAVLFVIET